jgi:hypothetical protein
MNVTGKIGGFERAERAITRNRCRCVGGHRCAKREPPTKSADRCLGERRIRDGTEDYLGGKSAHVYYVVSDAHVVGAGPTGSSGAVLHVR